MPSRFNPNRYPAFLTQHQSAISTLTFLLLFGAILFTLLVNLSTPIAKSMYLMKIESNVQSNPAHTLRFGVWGVCVTGVYNATAFLGDGPCSGPILGYPTPQEYYTLMGAPDLTGALVQGLEILWLMHPISTGLLFSMLILSFFLSIRDITIASLLLGILGAGAATFALAADIAFVVVAKMRVHDITQGAFKVSFGNAVWLELMGWLAAWGAMILIIGNCFFGVRKFNG